MQWSQATPEDWVETTEHEWRDLPYRPVPAGGESLDELGYVCDVAIQGVCLRGVDHYAVAPAGGGVLLWRWSDDLEDEVTRYRWGQVWEFRDGWVDRTLEMPDGSSLRHQGPDQRVTVYAEDMDAHRLVTPVECGGLPVALRPWSEWPSPPVELVRHGVWMPDDLLVEHVRRQRPVDWHEWMD